MNPALKTLGELRRGQFVDDLATEMAHLIDAIRDTGRKGTLTVKLDIGLAFKGDDRTLKITDAITVKAPQPEVGDTIMYATADGRLSRRDPRQMDIDDVRIVDDERETQEAV